MTGCKTHRFDYHVPERIFGDNRRQGDGVAMLGKPLNERVAGCRIVPSHIAAINDDGRWRLMLRLGRGCLPKDRVQYRGRQMPREAHGHQRLWLCHKTHTNLEGIKSY